MASNKASLRTNSSASIGSLIEMAVAVETPAEAPAEAPAVALAVEPAVEPAVTPAVTPAVARAQARARAARDNVSPLNMEDSTIPKELRSHLNKTSGSVWSPEKTADGKREKT